MPTVNHMPRGVNVIAFFNAIHTYVINLTFFIATFNVLSDDQVAQLAPEHQALYQRHINELQSGDYETGEYRNIKLLVHGSLFSSLSDLPLQITEN